MIYIYILNYNVYIQAESQFRVCVLWRTRPLWSVKASPSETLLTWSAVVKCDGLDFGAFPGCVIRCFTLTSWFLPPRPARVTIYTTRCHHLLSFFFGHTKNLERCETMKDRSGASSRNREKEHLEEPSDWDRLHAALWRNWPSNAPLKDPDLNWDTATVSCDDVILCDLIIMFTCLNL